MKKEEIENMKAGKELDDLVAEKVMGWHVVFDTNGWKHWDDSDGRFMCGYWNGDDSTDLCDSETLHLLHWHPSQSILWAWEVVEKLVETIPVYMDVGHEGNGYKSNCVHLNHHYPPFLKIEVSSDTMPLSICRAALLAVMVNET